MSSDSRGRRGSRRWPAAYADGGLLACLSVMGNNGGIAPGSVVDTIDLTDVVAAARAARLWAAAAAAANIYTNTHSRMHICKAQKNS